MSANELAKQLGVPTNRITEIIQASVESRVIRLYVSAGGLAPDQIFG